MRSTVTKQLISRRYEWDQENPYYPSVSASQQKLLDLVKQKIAAKEYKFESSSCPCGKGEKDVLLSEIDRYGIPVNSVLCMSCGTIRIDPYLDEASLSDFYTHIYRRMYGIDIQKDADYYTYFERQSIYAENLLGLSQEYLNPDSRVCEVGCGAGGAVKFFKSRGYQAFGTDFDIESIEFGKRQGVDTLSYGSLESVKEHCPDASFDLIYLYHVFEHLSDPVDFLEECRRCLTPNGKIMVVVPDIAKIDCFGHPAAVGNLLMYFHIAHKYNFSVEGIKQLSRRAGFKARRVYPPNETDGHEFRSPEIWMEIEPLGDGEDWSPETTDTGNRMLNYCMRTERLYSLGLCHGQIASKLSSLKSPKVFFSKLKRRVVG